MNLSSDSSTADLESKEYKAQWESIFREMLTQLHARGLRANGTQVPWVSVGISEAFLTVTQTIRYLRDVLPFIEPISKFPADDLEDFLNGINKALGEVSRVQIIDDKPTNPLNQCHIFEDINRFLEIYAGWKFNPANAREFLKEIANEFQAQKDFIGVLGLAEV